MTQNTQAKRTATLDFDDLLDVVIDLGFMPIDSIDEDESTLPSWVSSTDVSCVAQSNSGRLILLLNDHDDDDRVQLRVIDRHGVQMLDDATFLHTSIGHAVLTATLKTLVAL